MKPRHVAALALLSWYFLVPPSVCPKGDSDCFWDFNAPISQWTADGDFDSQQDCITLLEKLKRAHPSKAEIDILDGFQCVWQGDPRLAK